MRTLLMAGFLGAGLYLTGCETTVVDHQHGNRNNGYYDNGRNGHGDARYLNNNNGTYYRTQNVERTNVHETNVYETNIHRNNTNQTVVKTQSQGGQAKTNKQASPEAQKHTATAQHQSSKKVKAKDNVQNQNNQDKQHEGDAQERQ